MTNNTKKLIPTEFPLVGLNSIEASAGTGKTYTIAVLYVRILLGHGSDNIKNHQPANKILVVTFTDAATSELRDRIRSKIIETRKAFKSMHSNDPIISEIISDLSDKRDDCIDMLIQAERQINETAIHTIHGFCQRMLKQSAFETGTPFESEFITDDLEIFTNVISDYWRNVFYKLDKNLTKIVSAKWNTPSDMLFTVRSMISSNVNVITPAAITENSVQSITDIHTSIIDTINKLKNSCRLSICDAVDAIKRSGISKSSFREDHLKKWISNINAWTETETTDYSYPPELIKFSTPFLTEKTKGNAAEHQLIDEITAFVSEKLSVHGFIIADAIEKCKKQLEQEKAKKQLISFDDLLTNLSTALHSAGGNTLAQTIRDLYPIALIDESQDTDEIQYNIFKAIYSEACLQHHNQHYCLTTIGDPKQAIYSFRGADVHTYITAKNDAQNLFTLDTNWRSTTNMVSAVNTLFSINKNAFILDGINYQPVAPSPKASSNRLVVNGEESSALNMIVNYSEKSVSKADYTSVLSDSVSKQISTLLNSKNSYIEDATGTKTSIKPQDISILVRTADEANIIKNTLSKNGIDSVFLSAKTSVYASHEAKDLLRIATAMATPTQLNIKSALTTSLLDISIDELIDLDENENTLEHAISEFIEYNRIWNKFGIQAALNKILVIRRVVEKLMQKEQSERKIANVLHIAELLQAQPTTTPLQIIRSLAEKIANPRSNSDNEQLHLESDRDLVQIITIHKSKGLEYNIVFIPFALTNRDITETIFHDDLNIATYAPSPTKNQTNRARVEKLAEDVRLLYVAATRAVYSCYIGITPLRDGKKSTTSIDKTAIGWLLNGSEYVPPENIHSLMMDFKNCNPSAISIIDKDQLSYLEPIVQKPTTTQLTASSHSMKSINKDNWFVTSYSALTSHHSYNTSVALQPTERDLEVRMDEEEPVEKELNIFNFEKGATAGTFLHTIFEEINYNNDVFSKNTTTKIKNLMLVNNYDDCWLEPIQNMVKAVLDRNLMSTLNNDPIVLKDISMEDILPEMEFMFPITKINAKTLSSLISNHDDLSKNLPDLEFSEVSGMIKGFIDLTFKANGKFYVLDWKSNHLGDDPSAYTTESIKESMRDHRYDLQYQIYSLALHKLLESRIPDYDYKRHFGGAFYVYLRGVDTNENGIFYTKPSLEFLQDLEHFFKNELSQNT